MTTPVQPCHTCQDSRVQTSPDGTMQRACPDCTCPSCHAPEGTPHTDYCRRPNREYPGQPGERDHDCGDHDRMPVDQVPSNG